MLRASLWACLIWDHPREYGENGTLGDVWDKVVGSSPRIRGECRTGTRTKGKGGIIPANTGRMVTRSSVPWAHRDHPREYGENLKHERGELCKEGSSPRIRGEYELGKSVHMGFGIIPANTGRIPPATFFAPKKAGSSPRIRGEFGLTVILPVTAGIIPANTGRILSRRQKDPRTTDHPREYGENATHYFE